MQTTIKDIAKATGLGLATISSYLNGGNVREYNRIKIEEAIKELNFEVNEVARGLKTNTTRTIGIIIPELNNIFFAEIVTVIEDVLRSKGYATMICDCRSDIVRERESMEFLYKKRVDGLIIIPVSSEESKVDIFSGGNKPVVVIDRALQSVTHRLIKNELQISEKQSIAQSITQSVTNDMLSAHRINMYEQDTSSVGYDTILVNHELAVYQSVQSLLGKGHERIGIIGGPKENSSARNRYDGYERAMSEAGITITPSMVVTSDYTVSSGMLAMEQILDKNKEEGENLTAVIITNYETMLGGMITLHKRNVKIPEDLSVIGYDNMEFAKASNPNLEIILQPTKDMGQLAAKRMLSHIEDKVAEYHTFILDGERVQGQSVLNLIK